MFKLSTDISRKDRKVATLQDFKGLDTVHSPLNITYSHAIGMRNLINRDGANRKRKGWRQIKSFDAAGIPAGSWSGEIDFSADKDGSNKRNVFIHFYYLNNSLEIKAYDLADDSEITVEKNFTISDIKLNEIQTVYFENKLYSVGAGSFLYGIPETQDNVLKIVFQNFNESSDFYIPTSVDVGALTYYISDYWWYPENSVPVSFSIFAQECAEMFLIDAFSQPDAEYPTGQNPSDTNFDALIPITNRGFAYIEDGKGEYSKVNDSVLEDINALTYKIKNKASLLIEKDDSELNDADAKKYKVKVFRIAQMKGYSYLQWDKNWSGSYAEEMNVYFQERAYYYSNIKVSVYANGFLCKEFSGFKELQLTTDEGKRSIFVPDDQTWNICFAGKNLCVDVGKLYSLIGLSSSKIPSGANQFEFIIEFDRRISETSENIKGMLEKSTMLTLFGAEGTPNRLLFCDGSNTMLYSEYRDPFYVSEENTITLGSTPITAWIKGTETSLYVFKKFSRQEENLYVIDPQLVTSDSNAYNVNQGEVLYLNNGYSVPESAVNQFCACNLANDILIVSDDGVYGIEMSANVASTERFARSRAEQIKNELQRHDLSKTKCIVWDNKMFLAVDGVVFVADAKFRVSFDGDMSDTFNYEWWMWDHCPVKYWVIVNEKLCFVTDDNRICEFYDGFADYIFDNASVAVIDEQGITLSSEFSKYNKIQFANAYKALIGSETISAIGNSFLVVTSVEGFFEGQEVYFDMETGSATNYPFTIGTKYIVSEIDVDNKYIHFVTEDQTALAFTSGMNSFLATNKFRISQSATGIYNFAMSDEEENNVTVYDADGNKIQFISYNGEENYTATVFQWKPVVAEWQTGSYDFGTPLYAKTIEKVSIAFDRFSPKALKLYYNTANRGKQNLIQALQQAGNIDVSSISNASLINKLKNANVNNLVDRLKNQTDFDLDALSFVLFTFDQKFETSFTRSFLVRNFNYISFMLISDEEEDFSVNSISFIYKINRSNRGEI